MNKKERIILSSIEFMKSGINFSNIKVKDIAEKADIGKGTIYEYFDSKEDIFFNAILYIVDMLIEKTDKMYSDGKFEDLFLKNIYMYNELVKEYKSIITLFIFDMNTFSVSKENMLEINAKIDVLKALILKKFHENIKIAIEENIIYEDIDLQTAEFAVMSIAVAIFRYNSLGGKDIWKFENKMSFEEYSKFLYSRFIKIISE